MSQSIDRLENLIRVLRGVAPGGLDMSNWCNCAVGHASRDQYFIDEGLRNPDDEGVAAPIMGLAKFFGIDTDQAYSLFLASGYVSINSPVLAPPAAAAVIARLQVLLVEKLAAEAAMEPGINDVLALMRLVPSVDSQSTKRELEPVS
jgi:hypothetical protein